MKLNLIPSSKKPKHYTRQSRNQKVACVIPICIERNAKQEQDLKQAQQSAAKMKEDYEAKLNTKQQEAQALQENFKKSEGSIIHHLHRA